MPHATLPRVELTGRFTRNYSDREGLKYAVLSSGERAVGKVDKAMGSDCEVPIPFDVQGSVAKSTHAGLPWLRHLRRECKRSVHFWPFDGWGIPEGSSVVAEIYPSLWTRR
jgi:hypothetical protein